MRAIRSDWGGGDGGGGVDVTALRGQAEKRRWIEGRRAAFG
jgi:hypothetical protein